MNTNVYAKSYPNRRQINESEQYKLILFPADNSIAVVKSKQCSPAEHDGFFHVNSGGKKFTGVTVEEGSFDQCSTAADKMTKKTINTEIESDYERHVDDDLVTSRPETNCTMTSLTAIPFENLSSSNSNKKSNSCSSMKVTENIRPVSTVNDSNKIDLSKRFVADKTQHANKTDLKRKKQNDKISKSSNLACYDIDEASSDDNDNQENLNVESNLDKSSHHNLNPVSFVGQRILPSSNQSTTEPSRQSKLQQLLNIVSKFESQYLRSIAIAQQRQETMMKAIYTNQQKIQKTLRKQKLNIALVDLEANASSEDNESFLTVLEFTSSTGLVTDLLKQSGTKEHANRFVTHLMDILYQPDELLALSTADVPKEERYLLLKEAVRNKFRLNREELETMWCWLHGVFLAKRRTLHAKKRRLTPADPVNHQFN